MSLSPGLLVAWKGPKIGVKVWVFLISLTFDNIWSTMAHSLSFLILFTMCVSCGMSRGIILMTS